MHFASAIFGTLANTKAVRRWRCPTKLPVQRQDEAPGSPEAGPGIGNLNQSDFDLEFYERGQPSAERRPIAALAGRAACPPGTIRSSAGDRSAAGRLSARRQRGALQPGVQFGAARRLPGADSLGRAIELGYNDFSHLEDDPDLSSLRQLPQYQALLKQYGLNG